MKSALFAACFLLFLLLLFLFIMIIMIIIILLFLFACEWNNFRRVMCVCVCVWWSFNGNTIQSDLWINRTRFENGKINLYSVYILIETYVCIQYNNIWTGLTKAIGFHHQHLCTYTHTHTHKRESFVLQTWQIYCTVLP